MAVRDDLVEGIIQNALQELKLAIVNEQQRIVTFALFYDHESPALSVCADTYENSKRCVLSSNSFSYKHFQKAVTMGDLESAALWKGNSGRSLSLGDFVHVNIARKKVRIGLRDNGLFVAMANGLIRNSKVILETCKPDYPMVFGTSTATNEVGLVWTPPTVQ